MTTALVDTDIVIYRCSAASELDGKEVALLRTEEMLRQILNDTQADTYRCFLTGADNWRKKLYSEYKANRTKPKPTYLGDCRQYVLDNWNAEVDEDLEADDLLGINQSEDTIICSIDKDLRQIPGKHYDFIRKEFFEVGHYTGQFLFWQQMICGDRSDNIPGFDGKMRASVPKFVEALMDSMIDFESEIYILYEDKLQFLINANLLRIWKNKGEVWIPEVIKKNLSLLQEMEPRFESTLRILEEIGQLMGPIGTENGGKSVLGRSTDGGEPIEPPAA